MTGYAYVTKRKLKAAIELAKEDGKFGHLNPVDFKTVLWGKEEYLFHDAGFLARINTRSDGSIFVGYAEKCNPNITVAHHTLL